MKFNFFNSKISKPQQLIYLFFIVFCVGMALLIFSKSQLKEVEKETTYSNPTTNKINNNNNKSNDTYRENIEKKLEDEFSKIDGVGNVVVLVTMKTNGEIVINKDIPNTSSKTIEKDAEGGTRESEENDREETTVLVSKEDGSEEPIIIKEFLPEVQGVLIIAEGGDDINVKNDLINATKVLLDLPAHRIEVMKMVSK